MQSLRQLGGGIVIALLSILLVIGGISLALAETRTPPPPTPTPIPPTVPLNFPTSIASPIPSQSETPTGAATLPTDTSSPTLVIVNTPLPPVSCSQPAGWLQIITAPGDTIYSLAQQYKTTAENLSAANCLTSLDLPSGYVLFVPPVPTVTVAPCGPPAGWVKNHVVQPGDNLFRIALSYGITYPQLQKANCMGSSTTIYAGQRLWVPNIPTRTPVPGVTIIPDFPTATPTTTPTATASQIPAETATATQTPTEPPTSTPTATSLPSPTPTPTATQSTP